MTVARSEDFGELLYPGLRKIFYEVTKQIPSKISELFTMSKTDRAMLEDLTVGTLGDFPKFAGTIEYDSMAQGYKTTYEFPEFAKGFPIERKLYDDDQYNIINRRPMALALSAARRREEDAASIFNNAFSTSYLGADGKPLCSLTHPTKHIAGPTNRSNLGTNPFSVAGIAASRLAMRGFTDDRGNKILTTPTHVLIPPAKEQLAWEIFQSPGKTESAENDLNFFKGRMTPIVWDYLTSDENWFMIDLPVLKMYLNWFDRVNLEFFYERDFDTMVSKFAAYMRYGAGWSDWLGIYGNQIE